MSKLIRWETPFSDSLFPSVVTLVNCDSQREFMYPVEAIVSPRGLEQYPKYRVQFGQVVAFSAMEEMHFPDIYFNNVEFENKKGCAYQFIDSPWLESYRKGEYFLFNKDGGTAEALSHYVIFGGDDVFQVITKNEAVITEISEPMTLRIEFSI